MQRSVIAVLFACAAAFMVAASQGCNFFNDYGNLWANASTGGANSCDATGWGGGSSGGAGGGFGGAGGSAFGGSDVGVGVGGSGVGAGVGGASSGDASTAASSGDPSTGAGGGFGAKHPPRDSGTYTFCGGVCSARCATLTPAGMGTFSPSLWKFSVTIADDGEGAAGGWQQASVVLSFRRWTGLLPESWDCPSMTFGMPVRAQMYGTIGPNDAAIMSANVANSATAIAMHPPNGVDPPPGVFCSQLPGKTGIMMKVFNSLYPGLGARVSSP